MFQKDSGRFDQELFYTLNPGQFTVQNLEYKTEFFVNSAGLRDDENSLNKPQIICLGDSFTMGEGVSQAKTFCERLGEATGKKALNAGISSYGTVRELLLLNRLDLRAAETIILQHCANDYEENHAFFENQGRHISGSRESYDDAVAKAKASYFPGAFFSKLIFKIPTLFNLNRKYDNQLIDPQLSVPEFIYVFKNALPDKARPLDFIIFETNGFSAHLGEFVEALKKVDHLEKKMGVEGRVRLINLSDTLFERGHNFPIDGHLNSEGHETLSHVLKYHLRFNK